MKKKDSVKVSIGDTKISGSLSAAFDGMARDMAKHGNPPWLGKAWRWQHRLHCRECWTRARERRARAIARDEIAKAFEAAARRSRY